ncbi:MAG: hypothetical protein JSR53_16605 [Proteobacteria bacterium]|nr:hypothetical protein [Pseudomonadota bacterium]
MTTNKNAPELSGSKGAIHKTNSADFTTLQAAFAQQKHRLNHVISPDGTSTYWAERWGLVRYLPTLHDVGRFLVQIGGRL